MTKMHPVRLGRDKCKWLTRAPVWDSAEITRQNSPIPTCTCTRVYVHVCSDGFCPREEAANWMATWQRQQFKSDLNTYVGLKKGDGILRNTQRLHISNYQSWGNIGRGNAASALLLCIGLHILKQYSKIHFSFSDIFLGRDTCSWTKWSIKEQIRNKC